MQYCFLLPAVCHGYDGCQPTPTWGIGINRSVYIGKADVLSEKSVATINTIVGSPGKVWYIFKASDENSFIRAKAEYDKNNK